MLDVVKMYKNCNTCDMIVEYAYSGLSKEELKAHWNRRAGE